MMSFKNAILFIGLCLAFIGCSMNKMSQAEKESSFNAKNADNVLIVFQNISIPDNTTNELKNELEKAFKSRGITVSSVIYSDTDKEREYVLAKAAASFHPDYILEIKPYSAYTFQWTLADSSTKKEVWKTFTNYITDAKKMAKGFEKEYFSRKK